MAKDDAATVMTWIFGIVLICIAIPGLLYFGALILRPYFIQFVILFTILTFLAIQCNTIMRRWHEININL